MAGAVTCEMIRVDRKHLLNALKRIQRVVPRSSTKPILTGVRLEASKGVLRLQATDIESALTVTLAAEGELEPCVVNCVELINRVKSSKQSDCTLLLDSDQNALVINGGAIEHQLPTMDAAEFPAQSKPVKRHGWAVQCQQLCRALGVASLAVGREPSRYSINGILLEIEPTGSRLVATDGRRLVTVDLDHQDNGLTGKFILPQRSAQLLTGLISAKDDYVITLSVPKTRKNQPNHLQFAGPDWRLAFDELEGEFPRYSDVIPKSNTRFAVDRKPFMDVLAEVTLATDLEHRSVQLDVSRDQIHLSAGGNGAGRSTGEVPCELLGGNTQSITTGFNPKFLADALRSLGDDRVVLDLSPSQREHNQIVGKPALIYGESSRTVRWVIMPVSVSAQDVTIAGARQSSVQMEQAESTEPSPDQPSSIDNAKPKRNRSAHEWPEIGQRLDGEFLGETYAVLVVAGTGKSGRALQVINGPAMGRILKSPTAAMLGATEHQRKQNGQGESRKGLPVSGWSFWRKPQPRRASA